MDWFIQRLSHTNPTLDYQDLCNHADDFKKLLDLKIIKHSHTLESILCDLCDEDHSIAPFRNVKSEVVISCSGSRRIINPDELKIWTINKETLAENVKSKNPVINKTSFEKVVFASKRDGEPYTTKRKFKHTIDLPLPDIMQWEKVALKLKNGLKEAEIWYDDKHLKTADYIQFGFWKGPKQKNPDRSWNFICALSVLSATDIKQATVSNMGPMISADDTKHISLTPENVHQIKKTFTNRICAIFKTGDSPFYDNKDYYHPRFTLLPSPELRQDDVWQQGGKLDENLPYENTEPNTEE